MNSRDPWWPIVIDPRGDVVHPMPRYVHPFAQEVPSWVPTPDGSRRYLFEGVFVGADPGAKMSGITFTKHLDEQQVLHVEICVDGQCYRTQMDLAPAIKLVLDKLSRWHLEKHGLSPLPEPVVVGCVEAAVGEASDALIATLAAQHATLPTAAVGDIFGDIGHALSSLPQAVSGALKSLKGPLSVAAGAAATAFGGPAAGVAASNLAGHLIDAAPGSHPAAQAAAQQQLAAAAQAAKTDPAMQTALAAAQHAVAQGATAASGGGAAPAPDALASAIRKLLPITTSASAGGNPSTILPADLQGALALFLNTQKANATVSGIVGAAMDDVRSAAQAVAAANHANVVGVVRTARGTWRARGFRDPDLADDWLGRVAHEPSSYTYAAVYDKTDVLWPYPLNEMIGTANAGSRTATGFDLGDWLKGAAKDVSHAVLHPGQALSDVAQKLGASKGVASVLSHAVDPFQDITENPTVQSAVASRYGGAAGTAALQAARAAEAGHASAQQLASAAAQSIPMLQKYGLSQAAAQKLAHYASYVPGAHPATAQRAPATATATAPQAPASQQVAAYRQLAQQSLAPSLTDSASRPPAWYGFSWSGSDASAQPFRSLAQAQHWLAALPASQYAYAAVLDGRGSIVAEQLGAASPAAVAA